MKLENVPKSLNEKSIDWKKESRTSIALSIVKNKQTNSQKLNMQLK